VRQQEGVYSREVVLLKYGEVNRTAGRRNDVLQERTSGYNRGGGIAVALSSFTWRVRSRVGRIIPELCVATDLRLANIGRCISL
jgi:hypothetical protein